MAIGESARKDKLSSITTLEMVSFQIYGIACQQRAPFWGPLWSFAVKFITTLNCVLLYERRPANNSTKGSSIY